MGLRKTILSKWKRSHRPERARPPGVGSPRSSGSGPRTGAPATSASAAPPSPRLEIERRDQTGDAGVLGVLGACMCVLCFVCLGRGGVLFFFFFFMCILCFVGGRVMCVFVVFVVSLSK